MKEHGMSAKELAAIVGVSQVAIYLKIWGIKRWALTDVVKICGFFRSPDAEHLFVRNYNKRQFLESQGENYNV
jgi:hypothetical protein